jgi:alkylation response protein AidB-like acyl-CoA dehydrogenase
MSCVPPQQRAQRLVAEFAARAPEYDRSGEFPEPNLAALRTTGLLSLLVPAEAGGMGEGPAAFVRVTETIAEGCGATALTYTMHGAALAQIAVDARTEQRNRFFAEASAGHLYGIAFTDRAADGSNAGVTAVPDADGWRLHGRKSFVTGAKVVDAYLVTVSAGDGGFLALVRREGVPSLRIKETWDAMGMRASASHDLIFEGTPLTTEERLGPAEAPLADPFYPHGIFALGFAATSVGIAAAARRALLGELRHRADPDPGRVSQSARFALAEIETDVAAARALLYDAAETLARETGRAVAAVNAAKLFANRVAIAAADTAMQAIGGRAYLRSHPIERLCRDARAGALMRNNLDESREQIARWLLRE